MITNRRLGLIAVIAMVAHLWILPLGFRGADFEALTNPHVLARQGWLPELVVSSLPISAGAFRILGLLLWAALAISTARVVAQLSGPQLGPRAGFLAGLLIALSSGASDSVTSVIGLGVLLSICCTLAGFDLLHTAHTFPKGQTARRTLGAFLVALGLVCHPAALLLPLVLVGLLVFPFRERELIRLEARPSIMLLLLLFALGLAGQLTLGTAGSNMAPQEFFSPVSPTVMQYLAGAMGALAPWSQAAVFQDLLPRLGSGIAPGSLAPLVPMLICSTIFLAGFFLLRGVRRALLVCAILSLFFSVSAQVLLAGSPILFPNDVTATRPETLPSLVILAGTMGLAIAAFSAKLKGSGLRFLPNIALVLILLATVDSAVHVARCEARAEDWRQTNVASIQDTVLEASRQGPASRNTITCILAPAQTLGGIPGFGPNPGPAFKPPFQSTTIEVLSAATPELLLGEIQNLRSRTPDFSRHAMQLLVSKMPKVNPADAFSQASKAGGQVLPPSVADMPGYELYGPLRLGWQAPLSAGDQPVGVSAERISIDELPPRDFSPVVGYGPRFPLPTVAWRFTPGIPAHALDAIEVSIPQEGLSGTLRVYLEGPYGDWHSFPIHYGPREIGAPTIQHTVNLDLSLYNKFASPIRFMYWRPSIYGVTPEIELTSAHRRKAPSLLEPGLNFLLDLSAESVASVFHLTMPSGAVKPEFCDVEIRLYLPSGASDDGTTLTQDFLALSARGIPSMPGQGELFVSPTLLGPANSQGGPDERLVAPFADYLSQGLRLSLERHGATEGPLALRVHLRGQSGMDLGTTPWQSGRFTTRSTEVAD